MKSEKEELALVRQENAKLRDDLHLSNLRFFNLVDKSIVGYLVTDLDGKIIYTNNAALYFYNEEAKNILGEKTGFPVKPGHIENFEFTLIDNKSAIVDIYISEIIWEECDAYLAYLIDNSSSIIAANIETAQTLEIEKKATRLEKSERALTYLLEDVNEIRDSLEIANLKLKDLDKLKSMFIASMSHELRTPLNSIIGFSGIILQGMDGEINAQQEDHLGRVNRSAKHLLSLINDIIDLSKVEAGKIDILVDNVEINTIVNEAIDNIQFLADQKKLTIESKVPSGIHLKTDRKRLYQCILNFVSNAVKFTESGTITITTQDNNEEMDIIVSDTGIGISDENQQKLFLPFSRIESHLRAKTLGTGLGLYLTKKLITELLRGSVAVESQLGKGSKFTLKLPK